MQFFRSSKSFQLIYVYIVSGPFCHQVQCYSFVFNEKKKKQKKNPRCISTRVVCVNGKHPRLAAKSGFKWLCFVFLSSKTFTTNSIIVLLSNLPSLRTFSFRNVQFSVSLSSVCQGEKVPLRTSKLIIVRLLFDGFAYHRISFVVSITLFAKKSGFSSTEHAAFCHPLSCQESFDFLFGSFEAYCQGVEDEQARDAAREF